MEDSRRHKLLWNIAYYPAKLFLCLRYNYHPKVQPIDGPSIIVSNHVTDLDPLFLALTVRKFTYFVASEHVFRRFGKLLTWAQGPISRMKGTTAGSTAMTILRRVRKGFNVALFPEANRTFNGVNLAIVESTAKLVRSSGASLVTHRFRGGKDRLFLNFYNGLDEFYYKDEQADQETTANTRLSVRWGNLVTALRWNHIFSSKLFSNTTLAYNRYKMVMGTDVHAKGFYGDGTSMMQDVTFDYHSGMRDWSFKTDFDYTPVPQHLIRFGGEYVFHRFVPETVALLMASDGSGNGLDKDYGGEGVRHYGHDASLFFEDDMALGEYFSVNPGLHATLFATEGKAYFSLEPRLSLKYSTPAGIAVKAAYSRMSQYVHLLSSSQMSLPMDLWVPITKDIRPEKSDQGSLGVYFDGLKGWEFSLEGYFKWVDGVLEYKDGVNFMVGTSNWENKVEMGVGRAYGLELYVEKTTGKTTGWLGYTLAKSERRFPGGSISFGQWFPYRYDRRHNLNIVVNHHLTDNIDLGATWSFCTGGTTTMPERQAITADPGGQVKQTDMISHRNNYRLPASHHLNLSANFHRKHRRGESIWNISVYNVYNRMNPNFVFKNLTQRYDPASGSYVKQVELTKLTILPIIPSVGYTYNF